MRPLHKTTKYILTLVGIFIVEMRPLCEIAPLCETFSFAVFMLLPLAINIWCNAVRKISNWNYPKFSFAVFMLLPLAINIRCNAVRKISNWDYPKPTFKSFNYN